MSAPDTESPECQVEETAWRAIHASGRLARQTGATIAACPRRPFSVAAVVWLAGFTGSSIVLDMGTA